MVVHIFYKENEKFVAQNDNKFTTTYGVEKIRIRSNNGNTFSIKEVDGNMIIIN